MAVISVRPSYEGAFKLRLQGMQVCNIITDVTVTDMR